MSNQRVRGKGLRLCGAVTLGLWACALVALHSAVIRSHRDQVTVLSRAFFEREARLRQLIATKKQTAEVVAAGLEEAERGRQELKVDIRRQRREHERLAARVEEREREAAAAARPAPPSGGDDPRDRARAESVLEQLRPVKEFAEDCAARLDDLERKKATLDEQWGSWFTSDGSPLKHEDDTGVQEPESWARRRRLHDAVNAPRARGYTTKGDLRPAELLGEQYKAARRLNHGKVVYDVQRFLSTHPGSFHAPPHRSVPAPYKPAKRRD
eukprot:Hpha_TRINITY_DN35293_c0_g1::TRINITY_DN35293_c0_g1_i1::g.145123::m.145123